MSIFLDNIRPISGYSILNVLKQHGEMTPQQISVHISRTPKAISNILAKLKEEGLVVNGSKYGTWKTMEPTSSSSSSSSSGSSGSDDDSIVMTDSRRGEVI